MKKLLVILIVLASFVVAQKVNIQGTKRVSTSFIYFDPGSSETDSTLKILRICVRVDKLSLSLLKNDFWLDSLILVVLHMNFNESKKSLQSIEL